MDKQTQSFLELTATNGLVQLVADKRAAWLWSADGTAILWANAAGAAFFSARSPAGLANLPALERSPARPHIARIAETAPSGKFSIDRLRFYRGLRVMLLTCQCKSVELENGDRAALIICGDQGLLLSRDPVEGFAHLVAGAAETVFLTAGGSVTERIGALAGTPEDLELPEAQAALIGPLELEGRFHEGFVLQITDGRKLIVLDNAPLADEPAGDETPPAAEEEEAEDLEAVPAIAAAALAIEDLATEDWATEDLGAEDLAIEEQVTEDQATEDQAEDMTASGLPDEVDEEPAVDTEAEDAVLADGENAARPDAAADETDETDAQEPLEADIVRAGDTTGATALPQANEDFEAEDTSEADAPSLASDAEELIEASRVEDEVGLAVLAADAGFEPETDFEAEAEAEAETEADTEINPDAAPDNGPAEERDADDEAGAEAGFVFQPRRRPVRFAWKMDIGQRFTFLSDEFAEVLGPEATDIVGLTWEEVSDRFDLDPRGNIARALDRRDTWSGKTVNWPVSGAPLRVPVDMAALPAFDRNRKFEGYRGFGVCRTADAIEVEESLLSPALAAFDETFAAAPEATEPDASEDTEEATPLAGEQPADDVTDFETEEVPADSEAETPSEDDGDDELPETEGHVEEAEQPAQAVAEPAAAQDSIESLKPAQPNSFGGKTFLGASAAALVGSLAKFTGKPVPAPAAKAPAPAARTVAEPEPVSLEPDAPAGAGDEESVGAALDNKLKALETGAAELREDNASDLSGAVDQPQGEEELTEPADTDLPEAAAPADRQEDQQEDDLSEGELSEDRVESDEPEDEAALETRASDAGEMAGEEPESEEAVSELEAATEDDTEHASEKEREEEPAAEEPTGISGPAALMPSEIESAVKSLAKTYKAAEKRSRDLFDAAPADEPSLEPENPDEDDTAPALLAETVPDLGPDSDGEPLALDLDRPEEDKEETPDGDSLAETEEPASEQDEPEDDISADEREFFQETAAYEAEDQIAAEAAPGDQEDTAVPAKPTGEVIPLATVKPRVVPVDTSGLSRPERRAFRKIAEALGARLEGDLEDFDEPDTAEEPVEELPPDVPEAGPIDPSLLDRLPIGIAIAHDREVLYANKALLAMLGYRSIAALSEAGGLEALFIDDTEELSDAIGMEEEVDEAMKLRLADGGVLSVDAHMHSVPWNGNRGLMISITQRPVKQATAPASPNFFAEIRSELESARSQIAEMDTILETATDGVLVLDQNGTILKVNGSAEALFSANRAEMIGAPFTDFLAPESHRAAADYLDGLTRNGVASILNDGREVLGKVPSGGLIPLFMTMGRINGNKDEAKYCAVLRDITQWKSAEEELTQAKRQAENASSQKSDFLAKISHEIRTPLNAIIGFSEVMMEERFGPIGNDRYKDYLKDIRTSGSHIMSLINDLLDLSKIEAGKLDLKFASVSTNDVINECVALMQPQANRERVIIRASLPESVPNVVADQRSLRQIVLNLLSNAIKYNKSGGQVILSTALESNGEVALRVRDTGTGMTAKQLAAALEPFRQLHTATRGGGTGLGLPLTKALVEANRASFHIDSTPDQGTLVEIIFPTQRVLSE